MMPWYFTEHAYVIVSPAMAECVPLALHLTSTNRTHYDIFTFAVNIIVNTEWCIVSWNRFVDVGIYDA